MLTGQAYREQLEALQAMQDAVSTANALPRLRRAMHMRYKLYSMSFDYAEYCERCDEVVRADSLTCAQERARLEAAGFYGVETVRELFAAPDPTLCASVGELLLAAQPLSGEDLEEVAESMRLEMARYQQENAWLVGGPGFSRESAWVITVEGNVMPFERHFLRTVMNASPCGQSFHEVDGRVYDCFYMVHTVNGEPFRMEQWFDVTLTHKVGAEAADDDLEAEDAEAEPEPEPAPVEEEDLVAEDPEEDGEVTNEGI